MIGSPLVAVGRLRGAVDMAIAVAQAQMHMGCSTSKVASGWVVVHRLVFHADHVVEIEQKQESLTVEYGRKLGDSPRDSLSRQP